MDERDHKAMNEELKSAEEILDAKAKRYYGHTFSFFKFQLQASILESMEEYASQFKKQLKEKEEEIEAIKITNEMLTHDLVKAKEEIERLRSSLFTSERFRMEDAATSIDDRNILHAKHMECVKQLAKSNEMNERLAESLRKLSSQEHIEQDLYIRFTKDAFDILEQYQKSKK